MKLLGIFVTYVATCFLVHWLFRNFSRRYKWRIDGGEE